MFILPAAEALAAPFDLAPSSYAHSLSSSLSSHSAHAWLAPLRLPLTLLATLLVLALVRSVLRFGLTFSGRRAFALPIAEKGKVVAVPVKAKAKAKAATTDEEKSTSVISEKPIPAPQKKSTPPPPPPSTSSWLGLKLSWETLPTTTDNNSDSTSTTHPHTHKHTPRRPEAALGANGRRMSVDAPLPAIYAQPPVSMAKMIMSRHVRAFFLPSLSLIFSLLFSLLFSLFSFTRAFRSALAPLLASSSDAPPPPKRSARHFGVPRHPPLNDDDIIPHFSVLPFVPYVGISALRRLIVGRTYGRRRTGAGDVIDAFEPPSHLSSLSPLLFLVSYLSPPPTHIPPSHLPRSPAKAHAVTDEVGSVITPINQMHNTQYKITERKERKTRFYVCYDIMEGGVGSPPPPASGGWQRGAAQGEEVVAGDGDGVRAALWRKSGVEVRWEQL
ncbi:hypothetical protein C8R43DRAFT_1001607 [Mycena crocata]|nr:hypothetical protein C8R43DRAFT_1001607 [Mycena crocata]